MNEDTRMQEWVNVWVQATDAINYLVQKRQHILYLADHLFFQSRQKHPKEGSSASLS